MIRLPWKHGHDCADLQPFRLTVGLEFKLQPVCIKRLRLAKVGNSEPDSEAVSFIWALLLLDAKPEFFTGGGVQWKSEIIFVRQRKPAALRGTCINFRRIFHCHDGTSYNRAPHAPVM